MVKEETISDISDSNKPPPTGDPAANLPRTFKYLLGPFL